MLEQIMSGGQTGSDIAGLLAASYCSIATGGWIPYGWQTEKGPRPALSKFGLTQTDHGGYDQRTKWNVRDSSGTLIIAKDFESIGTKLTIRYCKELMKPFYSVTYEKSLSQTICVAGICQWIDEEHLTILNIVGNRESKAPGIQVWATKLLIEVFQELEREGK